MRNTTDVDILASTKAALGKKKLDISNKNEVQKLGMSYIIS